MPFRLSSIFADQNPELIKLQPYSESHPYSVIPNLAIPVFQQSEGKRLNLKMTMMFTNVCD
jgi:hypothetical protein